MAAPNTLIINNRTIVDSTHIIRAAQVYGDSVVQVGSTAMYTGSFVTPYITTSTLQLNGTATITGNANVGGTVIAGGFSTTGTTTTGNITLNGSLTTGNVTLRNNYVGVGRSTVEDAGMVTPYLTATNSNVIGTLTSGTLNATYLNIGNNTIFSGQVYYNVGNYTQYRNPVNGAIWATEGVQSDGLYFFNINNASNGLKFTLFRTSTGPSTSDPNLSIGVSTRVVGNLSADSNFSSGGHTTVGANLQVNGSATINGGMTIGSSTVMQNFEARNDSRILNASQPGRGVLYFGNGDKYLTWDGGNWIARGGAFYVSSFVAEGNATVANYFQVNSNAAVLGNFTVNGHSTFNTIQTNWIRTASEIRITGYGSGGLLRFGATDSVYMWYDAGKFYFNGGNAEFSNFVIGSEIVARGGSMLTHHNNASGTIYFGNGYNSWIDYNGGGLLSCPHDFTSGGTMRAANFLSGGSINGNTMGAAYMRSSGNIDAAGDMNASGVVNGGRLYSFGNIDAAGQIASDVMRARDVVYTGSIYNQGGRLLFGSDNGVYFNRDGAWLATNANLRLDGNARIQTGGGDISTTTGSLYTGPMRIVGNTNTNDGNIYTTSTRLFLENTWVYSLNYHSDIRYKNLHGEFMSDSEALSKITQLDPIKYTWKAGMNPDGVLHYGFSAQQVQTVLPDLVTENYDRLSVAYVELIPLMTSAIRDLKREIDELRAELAGAKTTRRKKV